MRSSDTIQTVGVAGSDRSPLHGGWRASVVGALVAALSVAALGEAVAFLALAVGALPDTSIGQVARYGWALFYVFHHVGFIVHTPRLSLGGGVDAALGWPSGNRVDAVVAAALLTGTAVAAWLLFLAGRSVGEAVGGPELRRAAHGAKVALPYALLSWVASWGLSFRLALPDSASMGLHPSHLASLFWPLGVAAVFGAAGGIRSAGDAIWTEWLWANESWALRCRAALLGGAWMLGSALALALVGLGVVAVVEPSGTASLLRAAFRPGVGTGLMALVLGALALPNAAAWVMVPAMGGCLEVGGGAGGSLQPYCFLSTQSYFGHQLPGTFNPNWGFHEVGPPPVGLLLFVLVPAIAVIAGGAIAARRAGAGRSAEGAVVGALAGGIYAVLLSGVLVLTQVTARFNGDLSNVATGYFRYGPYPPYGLELALLWGGLGGALGGALGAILGPRARREGERLARAGGTLS
jgi:hypothetical protein